jgi:acyl-coenzyme A thioesterase PaaI-like protein
VITPPPLPSPGTLADTALTGTILTMASKLPLVQQLSSDPNWTSWDAYSIFGPSEKLQRLTAGALGGSRGLGGYQRIFHNKSTGEFISVLWIGGALAGWPGVAHGGVLASVLDESMGRAAVARFPVRTGVTAKLEFNYKAPTVTNAFYVVRAIPIEEGSTDRKGWVRGTVEEMGGKVCVEAEGLFVVPKGLGGTMLKPIEKHRLDEGF